MTHTPEQLNTWRLRPYSWSQHSSFDYSPYEWYSKYLLGTKTEETPALLFGKRFADSCEAGTPLAPVTLYEVVENPLESFLGDIPLVGYEDSWCPSQSAIREFKTGIKPWDQQRVDNHGQLSFYALLHWLQDKLHPKDLTIHLDWLPTQTLPDFTLDFKRDENNNPIIHTFETKRTMTDVLRFASEIKARRALMEAFIHSRSSL